MTSATAALTEPLLHNSVNVMTRQRKETLQQEYPLYTHRGVDDCVAAWETVPLQRAFHVDGSEFKFLLHDAGHVLGSALTEIRCGSKRALYTGDLNLARQTLMIPCRPPDGPWDTVIMETTRGAQPTPSGQTRDSLENDLLEAIRQTFARGGSVLMPVFALGKTQEMLTLLHHARQDGRLPPTTIYIGGLGRVLTEVYDRQRSLAPRQHAGLKIIPEVRPETFDPRRLATLRPKSGQIYLVSSGMMTPHTTSHTLARLFFPKENDSIFFVGFTEPSSPAGLLRAAGRGGSVDWGDPHGPLPVRCELRHFDLTAHATREDLADWVCDHARPKKLFLVHGDPEAQEWFRQTLALRRPAIDIQQPPPGQAVPLFN
jgi:Cft2 family RNA processing exonuclease